jgi:hypothetical protein
MIASSKLMQLVLPSFGKASTPLSTGFAEAWLTMLAMGIKHGSDLMFGLNRFLLVFFSCTSSAVVTKKKHWWLKWLGVVAFYFHCVDLLVPGNQQSGET